MSIDAIIKIRVANEQDVHFATVISAEMAASAAARGTGISVRSPEYLVEKIQEGKAIIATTKGGEWVGFCYIEAWSHGKYVANSGLIVAPEYRALGVASRIKQEIFKLSRQKYPDSKIFGLTTGSAVMKINSALGYEPVTYSELTDDEAFWKGCQSCVNYQILLAKERKNCICTGMLYDPEWQKKKKKTTKWQRSFKGNIKLFERLVRLKKRVFLRLKTKEESAKKEKPLTKILNLFI